MKICACKSEVSMAWPLPDFSRSSSAVRMPSAANSPAVRSGLAKAGDRRIDRARVDPGELLVVAPQPPLDVRPVILDHHVRPPRHPLERRNASARLQVERHAALVAVQVLKVRTIARSPEVDGL